MLHGRYRRDAGDVTINMPVRQGVMGHRDPKSLMAHRSRLLIVLSGVTLPVTSLYLQRAYTHVHLLHTQGGGHG